MYTNLGFQPVVLPFYLENQVIIHYHSLSHSGINATYNVIQSRFVFKNMRAKVHDIEWDPNASKEVLRKPTHYTKI